MNNSGKTLTVFLIVIAILLVSLTTISVFFFLKEVELRKAAEDRVQQLEELSAKVQAENKEIQKQVFVFQEKDKESTSKIEGLMEELELEKGLREKMKKENKALTDNLETAKNAKDELKAELTQDLSDAEQKNSALQEKLDLTLEQNKALEEVRKNLEQENKQFKNQLSGIVPQPTGETPPSSPGAGPADVSQQPGAADVNLEKIVVKPSSTKAGAVISVDTETNFVIVNLGEKDGIKKDSLLSIYRGETVLGDVKVTRVLPEMSAADFVPPLTSQRVQKDDQVIIKAVK